MFSQDTNSNIDLIVKRADSIRIIDPNKALDLIEDLDSLLLLNSNTKIQINFYIVKSKILRSLGNDVKHTWIE